MCNGGDTYYIDLEPNRAGSDVAYAFTKDFDLLSQLHPLQDMDAAVPDSQVRGIFSFEVDGAVSVYGNGTRITVWPLRGVRITGSLSGKRRTATAHGSTEQEEEEDAEEEEHIMEDIMAKINDDKVSVSSAVADTAGETTSDDGTSSDTEEDHACLKKKVDAAHEGPSELVAAAGKTHL